MFWKNQKNKISEFNLFPPTGGVTEKFT